jgi:hypothetical protein
MKVTVPVAVPDPGELAATVAVKVTLWPKTEGRDDDVTFVVVPAWLTVWLRAGETLPVKLLLPL